MQDVTTVGQSIWDPLSPYQSDSTTSAFADDLPPFANLTTDEDRERKAERMSPGTYNVVVNPESFQHMPEYSDDPDIKSLRLSPLRRGSLAASLASSLSKESPIDAASVSGDPNIVVLPRFEDTTRRATVQWRDPKPPTSPLLASSKIKIEEEETSADPPSARRTTITALQHEGQDSKYMVQFRNVVWKQLVQAEPGDMGVSAGASSSADIMEEVAAQFPPLFHAMMAVAALSLAQQDGTARLDALQHYQQALPALQFNLRSADDLYSDGGFLTHFMLLVYEIAAAESGHSNLWAQHLSTLLQISLARREYFGGERYPYIIWWICNIDLYALFSGAGSGEFVGTMLNNDMIPPPSFHLYPLGIDGSSIVYAEEVQTLPTVLQLNYEVTLLAVRLGLLAQEFRKEVTVARVADGITPQQHQYDVKLRQTRVYELQEALRHLWASPAIAALFPQLGQSDDVPPRSRQVFESAYTLYLACLVYSHTSMWPSQRHDTGPESDDEIARAASQIIHTAERIINADRLELRFIVFPLFIAGYASTDGSQKMMALDLIQRSEESSIGGNTLVTRRALQIVYERQTSQFMSTGHSLGICWKDIMVEQGLQVVNFGI